MTGNTVHKPRPFIMNLGLNQAVSIRCVNFCRRYAIADPASNFFRVEKGGLHSHGVEKVISHKSINTKSGDFLNNFSKQNKTEIAINVFLTGPVDQGLVSNRVNNFFTGFKLVYINLKSRKA